MPRRDFLRLSAASARGALSAAIVRPVLSPCVTAAVAPPRPTLPVILCHGLLGFKHLAPVPYVGDALMYFRGIVEPLRQAGITVWAPAVSKSASIETRAGELAAYVERKLYGDGEAWREHEGRQGGAADSGDRRVHLVGHSMGGLDSRALIARHMGAEAIASAVSIGTPHRGSPVADFADDYQVSRAINSALSYLGIPTEALHDLKTTTMTQEFNPNTPDDPGVAYASFPAWQYGGSMPWSLTLPHHLIKHDEGENDGLVSVRSATWGRTARVVRASHLAQVGWSMWTDEGFDQAAFFLADVMSACVRAERR